MKMDFDKAYDHMEWSFILQSIRDIGLGTIFTTAIQVLLTKATSSVQVKVEMPPSFELQCSIRHGCPLSPLLFAIAVADFLGWLVEDKIKRDLVKGRGG